MNFTIQKALILIACLNIVLFVGGVRVVENTALNSFVNIDSYEDNNTVNINDDFKNSVPSNFENTGETSGLSFVDTLRAVTSFIIFMVNIIFTPIGLFATLPSVVGLFFGVPLLIGSVIALIYFVRSGR